MMTEDELRRLAATEKKVPTESTVRRWVEVQMKWAVPDVMWADEEIRGLVWAVVDGGNEERADLLFALRRLKYLAGASVRSRESPPGRQKDVHAEPHYRPNERLRRDALTQYLVRVARADERVRAFRRDLPGGRVLREDEAIDFICSAESAGKPLPEEQETSPGVAGYLSYQHPGYDFANVRPYWEDSPLHHLHVLSTYLAETNRWGEDTATMFILMDVTPMYEAATATIYGQSRPISGTITLTVSPWLDAKTVAAIYRAAQREVIEGDNRGPGERALKLFLFIERHTRPDGTLDATWQALMDLFNDEHSAVPPDEPYSHRGNFRTRYNDVLAIIRGYGLASKVGTAR